MTDPAATPASIPPGWYPDYATPTLVRWWDGTRWTDHTAAASVPSASAAGSAAPYRAVAARPTLPADRPVYSVFIWLIVFLPLLSTGFLFTWQPNFDLSGATSGGNGNVTAIYGSILTPGYFALILLGWLIYGLSAFFAYRDSVWLRAQGVVRPFPWPWIFLYSPVYIIGRSVIVHRVAKPRGRAPIWVLIAVVVLTFIITIVWSVLLVSSMLQQIPSTGLAPA